MASPVQPMNEAPAPPEKWLHTILFDVSGSMRKPLKLRDTSQDAIKNSEKLIPKRVQTVFDVICNLAEDGINERKDREIYAAVLCFGLRDVRTCDLLAFLEERAKLQELLDDVEGDVTWDYERAKRILTDYGVRNPDGFLVKIEQDKNSPKSENLFKVVGREPLVNLLSKNGAPYCQKYIDKHERMTPEAAGGYFMKFSVPERAKDVEKFVAALPTRCKSELAQLTGERARMGGVGVSSILVGLAANVVFPGVGVFIGAAAAMAADVGSRAVERKRQHAAVEEAARYADELYDAKEKEDTVLFLKSIPKPNPMSLLNVVQLLRRLRSMLNEGEGSATDRKDKSDITPSKLIDWKRLLDDIEPYLYGNTPMCKALRSVQPIIKDPAYSSKVLVLISDGAATDGDPIPHAHVLHEAGATIFACLLKDAILGEERRLYSPHEADPNWPKSAKAMFTIASSVSCDSGAVQALRRRGWQLPASGKCKLFVQANNPMIIDEFTVASRELGSSADALAEMIGQISLDDYIRTYNSDAAVTNQGTEPICWAHATATVVHLASKRVVGREVMDFSGIRSEFLGEFGKAGQNVDIVLRRMCPKYRLQYEERTEAEARDAIHARRPVIATFALDRGHWANFTDFFRNSPEGILTADIMNAEPAWFGEAGGHAVVLIRCDETSLTFMNSWGKNWGNKGFFTIDRSSTLECAGYGLMRYYDVYWTTDNLNDAEINSWTEHKNLTGSKIVGALPRSFRDVRVEFPYCKNVAAAREYDGTWYQACCRTCKRNFAPTIAALIRTLYENNYYHT